MVTTYNDVLSSDKLAFFQYGAIETYDGELYNLKLLDTAEDGLGKELHAELSLLPVQDLHYDEQARAIQFYTCDQLLVRHLMERCCF